MKWQTVIFWIIFVLTIICAFALIFRCAADQGDGALKLKDWARSSRMGLPIPEPREGNGTDGAPPFYPAFFFAATATDANGLTSDYSNEVVYQYTKEKPARIVTLAWDPSPGTNVITNYTVHWSRNLSGSYSNAVNCATNRTTTIRVLPPLLSNLVVTVTAIQGESLAYANSQAGPWTVLGSKTWTATNPIGTRFWRAYGKSGTPVVKIIGKWQ